MDEQTNSTIPTSNDLETMLRKTVAERLTDSPLYKQREEAAQTALTSGPRAREFLAQKVQETPLSPTQQQSIEASRRASDTIPLMTLNDLLGIQTGGIDNMISGALGAYGEGVKNLQWQKQFEADQAQRAFNNMISQAKLAQSQLEGLPEIESGLSKLSEIKNILQGGEDVSGFWPGIKTKLFGGVDRTGNLGGLAPSSPQTTYSAAIADYNQRLFDIAGTAFTGTERDVLRGLQLKEGEDEQVALDKINQAERMMYQRAAQEINKL